ncbi:MAG TPA: hypothetical protein VGF48_20675 [Thermoanaerobaculia bacterium]
MSTLSKTSPVNPAAAQPPTPEQLIALIRAIRDQIVVPEGVPAPASLRRRLAHVHPDFVNATINAAGVSEPVQSALGRTDEELRQDVDGTARMTAVIDELHALEKVIVDSVVVQRQRIGLAALQTYQICRQLARDERHAARLAPHIAEMKRLNRFGRRRNKPAEPQPAVQRPNVQ